MNISKVIDWEMILDKSSIQYNYNLSDFYVDDDESKIVANNGKIEIHLHLVKDNGEPSNSPMFHRDEAFFILDEYFDEFFKEYKS